MKLKNGFSDILQGDINFTTSTRLPGSDVDLMTSGTRRSDLTDLTTPIKLKEFFDRLKEIYDYVILDTPPIQPVSDTLFISQATVSVIEHSPCAKLLELNLHLKRIKNVNVKIDGLIFNDLDTSKASYYGYYQYGGYYNKYKSYS